MIEVIYDRKEHRVKVTGHAQSGEPGHDLVCAAASMLAGTLAVNVEDLSKTHRYVRRPKIKLESGDAEIGCRAVHGMDNVVTVIFDAVCAGFSLLEKKYPANVKYEVKT